LYISAEIKRKGEAYGIPVPAHAGVEDSTSFICTAKLNGGVEHFFPSTPCAGMLGDSFGLFIFSC